MALETLIQPINPDTFEYQTYSTSDEQLIVQSELDTVFSASTDYIEYYIYDQNQSLIYPSNTIPLVSYDIREGDVLLNPSSNLEEFGFDLGVYNISYSFYRKRVASSTTEKYFIAAISSDRTEIRLDSNIIENSDIISSANSFIEYRENAEYFVDFYLNFGNNETVIANNIKLETEEGIDPTVLIKLYEPLPLNFTLKNELWVVELLSSPQAYQVDFPFEPIVEEDFTYIAGPNYNLDIISQTASPGEQFSYNTLINSDLTSSINQIQSLLSEKEIDININYEKFSNFINFSSAKTRLDNFVQKVGLIQSASNQLSTFLSQIGTNTIYTQAYSSSKASLTGNIDTIIKNFDGYEYFLYFNSGSDKSYPKSSTLPPYTLYPTGSSTVGVWLQSQLATASAYDAENRDWLYYSIPEYLREDPLNRNYELFVDMVAQYYDNVWVYTKDITNKFDADNRLDYGISKDLVSDAIKDFAIKLYSNNFNTDDLFTAFLGLTPSGSAFPFPNITGSIGGAVATPTGFEYVDTKISASNDIVPLDDVNKRVYKRIYHNIPYLLKTKGTIAGIRALITSYGIPDTILRISEFGGKDRNESQDYDLKQDVFNYAFDTGAIPINTIESQWDSNPKFPGGGSSPKSVQLRFKAADIPLPTNNVANSNIRYSQSLWSTDDGGNLLLEYTGSGFVTGSYSGSIASPYDTYGTLKFVPAADDNPTLSASVYLPFFNGDWWSVQMNVSLGFGSASLYAANEIDGKIGFNESSSTVGFDDSFWGDASDAKLNSVNNITPPGMGVYQQFSGSFQEYRFWAQEPSQSNFYDYTVNPYSAEGNGVNGTPSQLYFRAALGTQLDTGSRTSIHPRVTGSAVQITSSFGGGGSAFVLTTPRNDAFVTNVEDIFQDQAPAGIKNRITDKIQTEKIVLAEAPYGFPNPSASVPEISSVGNDTQTLSPMESMQQNSYTSQSITPNIDYLEVAFSPSNQINDDINAQLGYFNLGEYIGDPRFFTSNLNTYPNLDRLRDAYFEKYMSSYDIVDFIRLIKFFDNSLFKMIKDFTPARTSLASGVVVKQHLLERNRQRTALVTSSIHDYEGLVVNLPKDYSSGSADFPQYSTSGSAIYKFSGGPGGSFNRFNGLQTYPDVLGTYGSLPGNTNLIPVIISNDIEFTTNGTFDDIQIDVPNKGNGLYPLNVDIFLDIQVDGLKIDEINTSATEASQKWSEGNIITIPGGEFSQGAGNIVIQLTRAQIQYAGPVTVPSNRFGITQSWQDGNDGSILNSTNFNQSSSQFISGSYLGPRTFPHQNQSEFYNGIFSGSMIVVATQSLNPGCDPYLNANDTPIVFSPIFFTLNENYFATGDGAQSVVDENGFLDINNVPPAGHAWIASTITNIDPAGFEGAPSGQQQVRAIKLSEKDIDGTEVINYLDDFVNLRIILPDAKVPYDAGAVEYIITGRTIYADHAVLFVSAAEDVGGNNFPITIDSVNYPAITSSINGGSMQWSLNAQTRYQTSPTISESADNVQQNLLTNPNSLTQEQNIYSWDGVTVQDALGFFNAGSNSVTTADIIADPSKRTSGNYTIPYTPNIPWAISASILYTGVFNLAASSTSVDSGTYHKDSSYQGGGLTDQNFVLGTGATVYSARFSGPFESAALAAASGDLTTANLRVYQEFPKQGIGNIYDTPSLENGALLDLTPSKFYKFSTLQSSLVISGLGVQPTFEAGPEFSSATSDVTSAEFLLTDIGTVSGQGAGVGAKATITSGQSGTTDAGKILRIRITDIGTGTYNAGAILTVTNTNLNSLAGTPFGTSVAGGPGVFLISLQHFTVAQVAIVLGSQGMSAPPIDALGQQYPKRNIAITWNSTSTPTLFRPAPKTVSDLGTIVFNGPFTSTNPNRQIPGNEGSGTSMVAFGGHPKIKVAGVAEMDWTFPSLTLAGVDPGLGGGSGTPIFNPFSGSAITAGNLNFTSTFNPGSAFIAGTIDFAEITGPTDGPYGFQNGGEIEINMAKVANVIAIQQSQTVQFFTQIPLSIDFKMITASGAGNSFQVQFEYKLYRQNDENSAWQQSGATLNSSNGTIDVTNQFVSINLSNLGPVSGGSDQFIIIRAKVKNTNANGSSFGYKIEEFVADARIVYTISGDLTSRYYPSSTGFSSAWGVADAYYQGTLAAFAGTIAGTAVVNSYSTAVVDVYLKRTGSVASINSGTPYDVIITGSVFDATTGLGGYSGAIHSGSIISFAGGPFLDIKEDFAYDGNDATSGSTRNEIGDMYYIEYSMSNFVGGVLAGVTQTFQNIDFQTDSDLSTIDITQSSTISGGSVFNGVGAFNLRVDPLVGTGGIGDLALTIPFAVTQNVDQRVEVNGLYTGDFDAFDSNRFTIGLNKITAGTGIEVSEVTASIFPSNSIWAPITGLESFTNFRSPINADFIVPTFYGANVLPFSIALDCQPLLNNYSLGRPNPYIMRVDYNNESGPIVPVNFEQILSGSAVASTVPESNYTQASFKNIRYDGVRSTTAQVNYWNIGDTGTFGKNPNVELRDAYFGYFNDLEDPYPNINGLTRANINYLIDEQGNALPPSLNQLSIDTFKSVFPNTTTGKLAIKSGKGKYKALGEPASIERIMQYVEPICYSQISGDNYSNAIPLSGSGYISKYDNDDATGIKFATFQAAGTSSLVNTTSPVQNVKYIISPTGSNTSLPGASSPYTSSDLITPANIGKVSYPATYWGTAGNDLNNEQLVSIQTSIVTTYVSERNGTRNELSLKFKMKINDALKGYNLEKIDCKVYSDNGSVFLIKDVTNYGWFDIKNISSWRTKLKPPTLDTTSQSRWVYSLLPIPNTGLDIEIDWEMNVTLFDFNLITSPKPKNDNGILALEWIFTANSGKQNIVSDDKLHWEMSGSFKNASRNNQQGLFFPLLYTGAYTPTTLTGAGTKDFLLAQANSASAPYWEYSSSINESNVTITHPNFIEMESSNFNEAYGTAYYQGDLPYVPGFSEYFPGNVEPEGTNFDKITLPLEIKENDEIRFGNNENFTYRILEVFSPAENISYNAVDGTGLGKVKLKLSAPVPTSVNKDFFVIRRLTTSPNSLYLDMPFPYGTLTSASIQEASFPIDPNALPGNSGSFLRNLNTAKNAYTRSISIIEAETTPGILYPDFPTDYLIESASIIVNDLITKRIIES